jgi:hypothetical protein
MAMSFIVLAMALLTNRLHINKLKATNLCKHQLSIKYC